MAEFDDDFGGDTTPPVPELPLDEVRRRTKLANTKLDKLSANVEAFVDRDTREHQEMRTAMAENVAKTSQRIETLRDDMTEFAVGQAALKGSVDVLIGEVGSIRRVEEVRQTVIVETDGRIKVLERQDAIDAAKTKRRAWLKVIGIVGTAVAGLATGLTALLSQC